MQKCAPNIELTYVSIVLKTDITKHIGRSIFLTAQKYGDLVAYPWLSTPRVNMVLNKLSSRGLEYYNSEGVHC